MRVAIIADSFAPQRTSAAIQLRDLAKEMMRQGHVPTMLVPASDISAAWERDTVEGVDVLRLRAPRTKDIGLLRRTLGELLMPFSMLRNLRKSPLASESWEGIVWYSPSIFLGPVVNHLKKARPHRSYLIIRDIFPEWAVDMGLMGKGLPYRFFKAVANYQYSVADVIGVQTPGNQARFSEWKRAGDRRVEVLQNWLAPALNTGCSIDLSGTSLAGRRVFVYAGNMGFAQGMDILVGLAARLRSRKDVGFAFVGRGSEVERLKRNAEIAGLDNVLFFDEIDPNEIPGLYAQCDIGMIALDRRHKTHNIPGKFLSYMQCGLPVLASINPGNDLVDLIHSARVGDVCTNDCVDSIADKAATLLDELDRDPGFEERCKSVAAELFSPKAAVRQIVTALES